MRTRNNDIHFRLSDQELAKLDALVARTNLTRQAYIRQIIFGLKPRDSPPPDFRPMMRQLYYCGNNLNQIARKAHGLGVIDSQKYDEAVLLFRNIVADLNRAILEPERQ
jgi:hypothetical protein